DPTPSVGVPPPVVRHEPAWYQGDLHSHTGHSDGSCPSLSGQRRVPCPEFRLLHSAVARGLDFLAVTDHNTTSTYNALLQWQPYFDTLLLMRGRELTTFHGHANLYGTSEFIDFRLGRNGQTVNRLLDEVHGASALISINHPVRPSGEECMGCGWTAKSETNFTQVDAIEVVNGPDAETRFSGIPFWEEQLSQGHRITGIGGSDVHQPDAPASSYEVGIPTTVVYARELSEAAILEGIRAGHVYLKLKGPDGPGVLANAETETQTAMVGDALQVKAGQPVRFTVQVIGGEGTKLEIVHNGRREDLFADPEVRSADELKKFGVQADGGQHWYRLNLRASDGTLLVLTNPIYLNFSARPLDRTLEKAK
ncbi:MAG: CehA/McbA family metallohydrolase, partial [Acidobacteria bacterium]|nr:CehA/McbA family metallohydrolase [Acidobacteriota bacterium]